MMIDPNCGYFNEERDDEYAPPYGECEECYRYDICLRATTLDLMKEIDLIDEELFDAMYPPSWARTKELLKYKDELKAELERR